jgi:hypothetical protein
MHFLTAILFFLSKQYQRKRARMRVCVYVGGTRGGGGGGGVLITLPVSARFCIRNYELQFFDEFVLAEIPFYDCLNLLSGKKNNYTPNPNLKLL